MAAGVHVKLGDEDLGDFIPGKLDLKQAFSIKATTGLTPRALLEGISELDPAAMQALVWFLRFRAGNPVDLASINFAYDDLAVEPVEEAPKDEATSNGDGISTSPSSPTSST